MRNICLGTIGAARVHAAAVIIKFVPQLGDDVVRNHVCRACILCIKTLAAAGAEPALLFVAIFFTRVGAFRMVLCGKKIIDGRKAESKIPVLDFYEVELFMTVISDMRSINNDVKRSPLELACSHHSSYISSKKCS